MKENNVLNYIGDVLKNMPSDWLLLTTHRLDIYDESLAKTQFLNEFESLYKSDISDAPALNGLPTAFDYIRLGHPLSCILEWAIARLNKLEPDHIISFSSKTAPILSILRKNLMEKKRTQILFKDNLPDFFDLETVKRVYGYNFESIQVESAEDIPDFDGSTVFISQNEAIGEIDLDLPKANGVEFYISLQDSLGSILMAIGNENYISEIQHVRRRETIAMTPVDCFTALHLLAGKPYTHHNKSNVEESKQNVIESVRKVTATKSNVLLGSSGLSVQYAIMMGLIEEALEKHPGKDIKIIVPPNCYGGTNDQARRVAACIKNVEVVDLPVDGDNDMVESTDQVLAKVAQADAVPYIIAEIPTNPRVEVPDLERLKVVLSKSRKTPNGEFAVDPVFILDQTFCPNVQFLSKEGVFSPIRAISYVSGSKFPSGGKCTAGYCVANENAEDLMPTIQKHLQLCDNEATDLQVEILSEQLPSMNQRIEDAYKNTREFVNFIKQTLPEAKINFVSEDLAKQGFKPSVFSLDLPTKGNTDEEKEIYKRALNQKLIDMMIGEIPRESKYCVSYGQLKGCYWTIPATSTQGTTKEEDKDYIARVSLSPDLDLEHHKSVFSNFVSQI